MVDILREKLIVDITAAFLEAEEPARAEVPNHWNLNHIMEVRSLIGKKWEDITPETLKQSSPTISFLSAKAFRYFLPGIMISTFQMIDDGTFLDENFVESFMFFLSPHYIDDLGRPTHDKKIDMLSLRQKKVLQRYLEYVTAQFPEQIESKELEVPTDYWRCITEYEDKL